MGFRLRRSAAGFGLTWSRLRLRCFGHSKVVEMVVQEAD